MITNDDLENAAAELEGKVIFRGMLYEGIEDHLKLPLPIQQVMHDVLVPIYNLYQQPVNLLVDAMMEYKS